LFATKGSSESKSNPQGEHDACMHKFAANIEDMNKSSAWMSTKGGERLRTLQLFAEIQEPCNSALKVMRNSFGDLPTAPLEEFYQITEEFHNALIETLELAPKMRKFYMEQSLAVDLLKSVRTLSSIGDVPKSTLESLLRKVNRTFSEAHLPGNDFFKGLSERFVALVQAMDSEIKILQQTADDAESQQKMLFAGVVVMCALVVAAAFSAV